MTDPPEAKPGRTHTRLTCPKCGKDFENLPLHLRGCEA